MKRAAAEQISRLREVRAAVYADPAVTVYMPLRDDGPDDDVWDLLGNEQVRLGLVHCRQCHGEAHLTQADRLRIVDAAITKLGGTP